MKLFKVQFGQSMVSFNGHDFESFLRPRFLIVAENEEDVRAKAMEGVRNDQGLGTFQQEPEIKSVEEVTQFFARAWY